MNKQVLLFHGPQGLMISLSDKSELPSYAIPVGSSQQSCSPRQICSEGVSFQAIRTCRWMVSSCPDPPARQRVSLIDPWKNGSESVVDSWRANPTAQAFIGASFSCRVFIFRPIRHRHKGRAVEISASMLLMMYASAFDGTVRE